MKASNVVNYEDIGLGRIEFLGETVFPCAIRFIEPFKQIICRSSDGEYFILTENRKTGELTYLPLEKERYEQLMVAVRNESDYQPL